MSWASNHRPVGRIWKPALRWWLVGLVGLGLVAGLLAGCAARKEGRSSPSLRGESPATRERAESHHVRIGKVLVDTRARTVIVPAWVNMHAGMLEYALVTRSGKTHESLLATDVRPRDVHAACLLLHAKPAPVQGDPDTAALLPAGSAVGIELEWEQGNETNRAPLSSWVTVVGEAPERATRPLAPGPWLFNGSLLDQDGYAADVEGSIISLIRDPVAVINNPRADRDQDEWHLASEKAVPEPPAAVRVVLKILPAKTGPGRPS